MKKILFALVAFTCVSLLCSAEEPATSLKQQQNEPATLSIAGSVSSIVLADVASGISSNTLTIVDDMNNPTEIVMGTDTRVYNASMFKIALNEIKKGDKVSIRYTKTDAGLLTAKSVQLVK